MGGRAEESVSVASSCFLDVGIEKGGGKRRGIGGVNVTRLFIKVSTPQFASLKSHSNSS